MDTPSCAAVFFDVGNTLASVRISAAGDRIEEMRVFPGVLSLLESLRHRGIFVGILSNPGSVPTEEVESALVRTGLSAFLTPSLVLYGSKESPRLFEQASSLVTHVRGCRDPRLLFVGEDANERAQALAAGFLAVPHPVLTLPMLLSQESLRYLRIHVPGAPGSDDWRAELRKLPLVPLHLAAGMGDGAGVAVYAVGTTSAAAALDDLGFWVDRLGKDDEPQTSDLYLLRDDLRAEHPFLVPAGNSSSVFGTPRLGAWVLTSTPRDCSWRFPRAAPRRASTSPGHATATT